MSIILYEDPKLAKIASRLKKARICKGYTQESLAELSGVNIKSIIQNERWLHAIVKSIATWQSIFPSE